MYEIWETDRSGNRVRTIAYANTMHDALINAHTWATVHGVKNIIVYDTEMDDEYRIVIDGWPCTYGPMGNATPITNWFAQYDV